MRLRMTGLRVVQSFPNKKSCSSGSICAQAHTRMRTTLNIDDDALAAAMEVSEGRTKTEVVNEALRQFSRAKRRRRLLELRGKVSWQGNVDDLRKRR